MATTFKSYSEKSKARRALVQGFDMQKEAADAYLAQVDGKWGFYVDATGTAMFAPADAPIALTPFGAFALSQLTAPSNTAPVQPERTSTSQRVAGLKIEKNREERNGVKMPSIGGMCRAVWDALNNLMTHDEAGGTATVPTVADIKALAEEKGWNVNNASIEYYQWRKWHGITGRGKKTI